MITRKAAKPIVPGALSRQRDTVRVRSRRCLDGDTIPSARADSSWTVAVAAGEATETFEIAVSGSGDAGAAGGARCCRGGGGGAGAGGAGGGSVGGGAGT